MAKNLKDIANQYAKAIFELSTQQNNVDATRSDLNALKNVFNDNPNFVVVVTSNDIDSTSRDSLLTTLTTGAAEPIQNLVKLLAYNNRLAILPQIVDSFDDYYNEANGIVDVSAITAVALDDTRLAKLAAVFASKTGAQHVNLKNVVDQSILGGVILQSQSTLIDGSLKTKIAKMKAQLLG
ncbi:MULTISPECIES: ATP synthase F1 subunit delta [Leuconostoc]|uniref:ATP synthase subunit delta n=2 Tax=Leuconostoc kimchii TaxID=136609 RepID=D5T3F9_LEUKI|nr:MULTISPECIES: ATP synthase F1 subunit delta [Leuconostoc]ADG40808.1 ATP synthase delta subunit [Leuconostoc kimchii IMSNU 11154]AEJ31216.1 ATP synthase delta subunit [Leuconostoc sp. C2]QBR48303.1 F0F1 ATP synthase subunit delta [Leuconostoc kimchii]